MANTRNEIQKWRYALLVVISVSFILFQLYIAMVRPLDRWLQVPYHMCFGLLAAFMFRPMADNFKSRTAKSLAWIYDIILVALLIYIAYFFTTNLSFLQNRIYNIDEMRPSDLMAAYATIFVVMEAVRRIMGRNLFIFIMIFIIYAFLGQKLTGIFQFRGMSWQTFGEVMIMDVNGILGSPLTASMNTLFYFLVFGAFFSSCGGGQVLIDLGMKLSDKTVGGPAKAAVLSSGLMGMVSGSAVANVSTTGVMTIPLMIKSGYEPHQAASIESIASTGGQIMPPIMGIGAFIMAEMIGVSYLTIASSALIPALAYYGSVFLLVHFLAKRKQMVSKDSGVKYKSEPIVPRLYQLLPIVALVTIIFRGGSLTRAALTGTALAIIVSLFSKKTRMSLKGYVDSMLDGIRQAAGITVPTAAIGIMIGIVIQSGVANKLTKIIANTGDSSIALALIFAMSGCLLLGMALPTVAAYLIANILFGSTLINLGLPALPANLFIFYFGVIAQITPPVCLASFTAAGIAGANPWKTGWTAFGYAFVAFIVPYVFVFKPEILLMDATPFTIAIAVMILAWGIIFLAAAVTGYLFVPIDNVIIRAAFFITAIMIIIPNTVVMLVGSAIGLVFITYFFLTSVKRKKQLEIAA
ncbi:TRAP transporter, 4TM/12TM fusion protein [Dethiosulfatibacter aminovorans DSM 17477]|uniref:TRAP transporter, 4TM/12TM fusion protein n=1 Tax=Dethiosulfatibacter aminovorans DSM 17477 TaxID=1121476 RepID=A0A1M6C6F3_9FIRM|nr:TRAP transporter fused permease subunit [Dethiosulfatibacter aminovorans]SHI56586.1 TRAP transporter, 4TM/12TM fusion protein [Dethiosulfatibacter aminovorans DSM 17477]